MNDDRKMRIFLNSNITMSRGKAAAHAVHAALLAAGIHPDVPIIVLGAKPREIEQMQTTVRDSGRTELEPGTLTAGTDYIFDETPVGTIHETTDWGDPTAPTTRSLSHVHIWEHMHYLVSSHPDTLWQGPCECECGATAKLLNGRLSGPVTENPDREPETVTPPNPLIDWELTNQVGCVIRGVLYDETETTLTRGSAGGWFSEETVRGSYWHRSGDIRVLEVISQRNLVETDERDEDTHAAWKVLRDLGMTPLGADETIRALRAVGAMPRPEPDEPKHVWEKDSYGERCARCGAYTNSLSINTDPCISEGVKR